MSNKTACTAGALLALAVLALPLPAAASGQQGMVVVRDPVSGQLRAATPAEVKALRAQDARRGLVPPKPDSAVIARENGTLHKHLGESGMVYSVTVRDPDGKLSTQCVKGEAAANAALSPPTPAARPTEEHSHESN